MLTGGLQATEQKLIFLNEVTLGFCAIFFLAPLHCPFQPPWNEVDRGGSFPPLDSSSRRTGAVYSTFVPLHI